jgi:hypothetical protein
MRRTIAIISAALVLLTFATGVFAQDEEWLRIPYRLSIAVDAGIGMPLSPAAFSKWNSTLPATISVGYVIIPQVEIQGWFTYAKWSISGITAQNEMDLTIEAGDEGVTGGSITTMLYGAAAKIYPLPKSRIMPTFTVGGGFFTATAEDIMVEGVPANSMEDADGPVFLAGVGMEYGINERWNVYTEFKYTLGISDNFAPENLILRENQDPVEGDNLGMGLINLGIMLKL